MMLLNWLLACVATPAGDADSSSVDADGDGYAADADCDDRDEAVFPRADEVCNAVDDNCDGVRDEGCEVDPNASWVITVPPVYGCSAIAGTLGVESVETSVDADGRFGFSLRDFSGFWGTLTGWPEGDTFTADALVASYPCSYDYTVVGSFVGPYEMRATLGFLPRAESQCGDCTDQSWAIVGKREE